MNLPRLPIVFLALVTDGSSALLRSGTCLGRKAFCQAEETQTEGAMGRVVLTMLSKVCGWQLCLGGISGKSMDASGMSEDVSGLSPSCLIHISGYLGDISGDVRDI